MNRVGSFIGLVQEGRNPAIRDGSADPFGCAYRQLCPRVRVAVSESTFRTSRGQAVSEALSADSWEGPSPNRESHRALRQQHSDTESTDPGIRSTWVESNLIWQQHLDPRTTLDGTERREKWRISLTREAGHWRVCGFTRVAG